MKKIYLPFLLVLFGLGAFAQANLQTLPQVLFTAPGPVSKGASSPIILNKIVELVDNVPVGDTISMSIYMLNYDPLITALKNADTRGVILRLIIDNSRSDSQSTNASTYTKLASLSSKAELIKFTSDAGSSSINHCKFILFSKVNTTSGTLSKVLLQTSHNFTLSDSKKLQDGLIFNDVKLYNAFWKYFNTIKNLTPTGMATYIYTEYADAATGIKACFLPRRGTSQPDNIIEILNSVTDLPNAVIKVGMSDWVVSRLNVAQKLTQMSAAGARVEVVVKNKIDPEIQTELAKLNNTGGYLKMYNLVDDDDPTINIHAKFMVIEGTYKGVSNSKVVVTGSHNFTTNALRYNNEILMELSNLSLFAAYKAWFDNIKYIDPPVSVAKWNLFGMAGNEANASVTSTFSGITADAITRGAGYIAIGDTKLGNGFTATVSNYSSASLAKAKTNSEYYQFALNVGLTGNNKLSLYTIDARLRRSGAGNNNYIWAYSLDGSNYTDISSSAYTMDDSEASGIFRPTVDLRIINELQGLPGGTKVYFRLYGWGATTSTGTFAIGKSANANEATLDIGGVIGEVLPVSLTSFTAKKENDYVKINWQTQSEKNNAGYTLLRATDGKHYTEIYQTVGQGTKETATSYQFLDRTFSVGTNYYQLQQIDYNGQSTTYGPVAINFNLAEKNILQAATTENGINVYVSFNKNTSAILSVYSIDGSLVANKPVRLTAGNQIFNIVANIPKGVYIVKLNTTENNITSKIVK